MATEYPRQAPIDPRKSACAAQPSPWFVHPFEEHARGAMRVLRYYSRAATDGQRAELLADVCWKLYGDYFRMKPKVSGTSKTTWVCPALVQPEDDGDNVEFELKSSPKHERASGSSSPRRASPSGRPSDGRNSRSSRNRNSIVTKQSAS